MVFLDTEARIGTVVGFVAGAAAAAATVGTAIAALSGVQLKSGYRLDGSRLTKSKAET